jgi:hypothetical protein
MGSRVRSCFAELSRAIRQSLCIGHPGSDQADNNYPFTMLDKKEDGESLVLEGDVPRIRKIARDEFTTNLADSDNLLCTPVRWEYAHNHLDKDILLTTPDKKKHLFRKKENKSTDKNLKKKKISKVGIVLVDPCRYPRTCIKNAGYRWLSQISVVYRVTAV